MQILGPHPNGKKAVWYLLALEMPSENLSGLNSLASFPQIDGGIMVNEQKGHQKVYSSRVFDPTELNFLVSSSV